MSDQKLQDKLAKVNQLTKKKKYLEQKRSNRDFLDQGNGSQKNLVQKDEKVLKSKYQYENLKGKFVLSLKNIKASRENKRIKRNLESLNSLNETIAALNTDLTTIDNTLLDKVSEIELQQRELSVCNVQINELEKKIKASKKESKLKLDATRLNERDIKEYEKKKIDLRSDLEIVQTELGRKKKGNEWQGELLKELLTEKDTLEKSISNMRNEIALLVREETEANQNIELLKNEMKPLKITNIDVIANHSELAQCLKEKKSTVQKIEKEISNLQMTIEDKTLKIIEGKKYSSTLNLEINVLQKEVNSKKNYTSGLMSDFDDLESEIEERKIELASLEIELRDEVYTSDALKDKLARLKQTLQNFEEERLLLKKSYEAIQIEIKGSEEILRQMKIELEQCRLENLRLTHMTSDEEVFQKKLEEAISTKSESLEIAKATLKKKQTECYDVGVANRELTNTVSGLNEQQIGLSNQLELLETKESKLTEEQRAFNDSKNELTRLTIELQDKISSKKEMIKINELDIEEIKTKTTEQSNMISLLTNESLEVERALEVLDQNNTRYKVFHNQYINEIEALKSSLVTKKENRKKLTLAEENLKATSNELITEVNSYEEEIKAQNADKTSISKRIVELKERQEGFKKQKVQFIKETQVITNEIKRLDAERKQQDKLTIATEAEVMEVKNKIANLNSTVEVLKLDIVASNVEIDKVNGALASNITLQDQSETEKNKLEKELLEKQHEYGTLLNQKEQQEESINALSKNLQKLAKEKSELEKLEIILKEKSIRSNTTNNVLNENGEALENKIVSMKNTINIHENEISKHAREYERLTVIERKLKKDLLILKEGIPQLQAESNDQQNKCKLLDKELEGLRLKKNDLLSHNKTLEQNNSGLSDDNRTMRTLSNSLVLELKDLKKENENNKTKHEVLCEDKKTLEKEITSMKNIQGNHIAEIKNQSQIIEKYESDVTTANNTLNKLITRNQGFEKKMVNLAQEAIVLASNKTSLIEQLRNIESKVEESETSFNLKTSEVSKLRLETEKTKTRIQQRQTRAEQYDQTIDKLNGKLEQQKFINEELHRKSEKINVIAKDHLISEIKTELVRAEKRHEVLKKKMEDKLFEEDISLKNITEYKAAMKEKTQEIKKAETSIKRLNIELTNLSNESKQLYRENAGLTRKRDVLDKREKLLESTISKRLDTLSKTRDKLQNSREVDILMAGKMGLENTVIDSIMAEDELPPALPRREASSRPSKDSKSNVNSDETKAQSSNRNGRQSEI